MNISLDKTKRTYRKTRRKKLSEHDRDLHLDMMLKETEPDPLKKRCGGNHIS